MTFLSFLPLLLALVIYAMLAKLAARLFRRTMISWGSALLFALAIFILSVVMGALASASGMSGAPSLLIGILLHICLVVWFFRRFAKTADDLELNPIAAVKLTGVFFSLAVVSFGGMWLVATMLLRLR